MEVAVLSLLLFLKSLDSGSARVSLSVVPESSQVFKYDSFFITCEEEEEEAAGWTVMKRTQDGEVSPCGAPCSILSAFPATDSGVYWCETGRGQTSEAVNITVTAGPVVLRSPALPVSAGTDVMLSCGCRSACNLTARFYRDGVAIATSATGNATLRVVSSADAGLYTCSVGGVEKSPPSWLSVTARPTSHKPPAPPYAVSTPLRLLLVGAPYLLSTVLVGLIYRDLKGQHTSKAKQTSNDVIMEIVISHPSTSGVHSDEQKR